MPDLPGSTEDPYAATRCHDCDVAKHICDLLRLQGENCCDRCKHTRQEVKPS